MTERNRVTSGPIETLSNEGEVFDFKGHVSVERWGRKTISYFINGEYFREEGHVLEVDGDRGNLQELSRILGDKGYFLARANLNHLLVCGQNGNIGFGDLYALKEKKD